MLYKTLIRPTVAYGSESWPLSMKDESLLRIFERRIVRRIYSPINEGGIWRLTYNTELHKFYNGLDIVKSDANRKIEVVGHLFRMQELDPCRKLTLHKPEGTRRVGKPRVKWLESVETDLRKMGVKNWSRKTRGREEWRTILNEAKLHQRL
jgi:hypothetical protein